MNKRGRFQSAIFLLIALVFSQGWQQQAPATPVPTTDSANEAATAPTIRIRGEGLESDSSIYIPVKRSISMNLTAATSYGTKITYTAGAFNLEVNGSLIATIPTLLPPSGESAFALNPQQEARQQQVLRKIKVY